MTNFRIFALSMQYLFGIYEYLVGHDDDGSLTQEALDAGYEAMQCTDEEREQIASMLASILLQKHPAAAEALFSEDTDTLGIILGTKTPSESEKPMDESRRQKVIECLFEALTKGTLLAARPASKSPISTTSFMAIMEYTKEEARKLDVSDREFKELLVPIFQELFDPGDTSGPRWDPSLLN